MIASEIEIKTADALAGMNVLEECFCLGITQQGTIHSSASSFVFLFLVPAICSHFSFERP